MKKISQTVTQHFYKPKFNMGKLLLIIGAIVACIAFLYWLFSNKDENSLNFFQALFGSAATGAAFSGGCFVILVEILIAALPIILIVLFFQSC